MSTPEASSISPDLAGIAPPMPSVEAATEAGVPPLVVYLDGLVEHLHAQLPAALGAFEVSAVHQARVTTRRLGAATSLLGAVLPGRDVRRFRKILRKLRRTLGPHRDLDVILEHLRDLGEREPAHRLAVEAMSAWLVLRRDRLREQTREEVGVHRMSGKLSVYKDLRSDLLEVLSGEGEGDAGVGGRVWMLIAEGVREGFDEFSALSDLLSHQLAETAETGGGLSGLDPHELRIAGKHLRYSLELAVAFGSGMPKSVLKDFKVMQDALGAWHDEVVLAETAVGYVTEAGLMHRDAALAGAVLRLAGQMAGRASDSLRGFAGVWTERGGALAETLGGQWLPGDTAGQGGSEAGGDGSGDGPHASPDLHSTPEVSPR